MPVIDPATSRPVPVVGAPGLSGKSAYESWLDGGNAGTEAEFVASTQGKPGEPGRPGLTGPSAEKRYLTASTSFPASTYVVDQGDGTCAPINVSNPDHRGKGAGIVTEAAVAGVQMLVHSETIIDGVVGSFSDGDNVFPSDGSGGAAIGTLTNVPPSLDNGAVWRQQIGRISGASSLAYRPGIASLLTAGSLPVTTAGRYVLEGTTAGTYAAGDDDRIVGALQQADAQQNFAQIEGGALKPEYLDGVERGSAPGKEAIYAPPSIRAPDYVRSIMDLPGAFAAQQAGDNADWAPVFTAALSSGDRFFVPDGRFFFKTVARVVSDAPVHMEGSVNGFICMHPAMPLQSKALIELRANTRPSAGGRVPLYLSGLNISFTDRTRVENLAGDGAGWIYPQSLDSGAPGAGIKGLDINGYYQPVVDRYFCNGGSSPRRWKLAPDGSDRYFRNNLGFGVCDTALDMHSCFGGKLSNITGWGIYDVILYVSGEDPSAVLTNPFVFTAGSRTVRVNHPGHGLQTGRYVCYTGTNGVNSQARTTAVGNTSLYGAYTVTRVDANAYTITIPATQINGTTAIPTPDTSGTGGGTVTVWSDTIQQEGRFDGEGLAIDNLYGVNSSTICAVKRGQIDTQISDTKGVNCLNGIKSSIVDGPTGGSHLSIRTTRFKNIQAIPFEIHGPNGSLDDSRVNGFGKMIGFHLDANGVGKPDGLVYTERSSDSDPIAALIAVSAPNLRVKNLFAIQEGNWAAGVETPNLPLCGITASDNPLYNYGTTNAIARDCVFQNVDRAIHEFGRTGSNKYIDCVSSGTVSTDRLRNGSVVVSTGG